ncbi:hypothetical protein RJ639_008988, partial [Escallonia herrerae]
MATTGVYEVLPPSLDSTSQPPPLFDGTTRLYINYQCPFAQRVWITRNYKGLQDKIKLVPIDLQNRPAWYKEKVYPENKVPALEHNNKVLGESLDLIKYVDSHFEGPALYPDVSLRPFWSFLGVFVCVRERECLYSGALRLETLLIMTQDPTKKEFAEKLLSYTNTLNSIVYASFKGDPVCMIETIVHIPDQFLIPEPGSAFDHLEAALGKFDDGPFFLGQFSLVDIAYVPFIERFQIFLQDVWKYDITAARPKLAAWIEEMNKIDAYKQTKCDPKLLIEHYKSRFM